MSNLGDRIINDSIIYTGLADADQWAELRAELITLRKFREQVESFGPTKAALKRAAIWEETAKSMGNKLVALAEAFRVLADEIEAEGFHAPAGRQIRKVLDEHTR